ncbi:MAG: hypothetical protein NTU98_14390 [Bacteroidetes bacterium]|nr:hypothetical protein [Bacteroidota bacterium]
MKKLIFFMMLAVAVAFTSCVKEKSGFGSSGKISGNLITNDSLSNGKVPVPNAMVYVGFDYKPNTVTYSYKTPSDKYGHFEIPFLLSDGKYQLYAIKSYLRDGVQYTVSLDTNLGYPQENLTLFLRPDLKTGRLSGVVEMHDSLTNGSMTVRSADVYIGYNFVPNSTHYTYKLQSDANGFFISPLVPFSDTLNYTFFATKNIFIGGRMMTFSRIRTFSEFRVGGNLLELLPTDSVGFVRIMILDRSGSTPQPNVTWCLYSDPRPFYKPKPCEGSFYSSSTNINGLGYVSGLAQNGKYYIKGYKPFGNDTLWVKDSLVIPGSPYPDFTFKFK